MTYQPRKIQFLEIWPIDGWMVKVYLINADQSEHLRPYIISVREEVSKWLKQKNSFDPSHDGMAFLIIHKGTEGVFFLINWWVGKNMLNTHIYFSEHHSPGIFNKISGDGLAPCIWELEVINHERLSWVKHILKKTKADYLSYTQDGMTGEF